MLRPLGVCVRRPLRLGIEVSLPVPFDFCSSPSCQRIDQATLAASLQAHVERFLDRLFREASARRSVREDGRKTLCWMPGQIETPMIPHQRCLRQSSPRPVSPATALDQHLFQANASLSRSPSANRDATGLSAGIIFTKGLCVPAVERQWRARNMNPAPDAHGARLGPREFNLQVRVAEVASPGQSLPRHRKTSRGESDRVELASLQGV